MPISTLFFDLDDTVYPNTSGLWDAIQERMIEFMIAKLSLPAERIPDLRKSYYETYGTTLRGLQQDFDVEADEFLSYVHDLPLQDYLEIDERQAEIIRSLPQKKWIFTNADSDHAVRVLAQLRIADCFEGIIDVRVLGFHCKPESEAYRQAIQLAGADSPQSCALLDDAPRNLAPARQMGITTVLVGSASPHPSADYSISTLSDLPKVLPQLWTVPLA